MIDPAAWYDAGVADAVARLHTVREAVRSTLGSTAVFVVGRVKARESFLEKMRRKGYIDPATELPDLVGVRVVVSRAHQVDDATDKLQTLAAVEGWTIREIVNRGEEPTNAGVPGYRATHVVVEIDGHHLVEIQMMTVLQHAWAALQHDLVYKGAAEPAHVRRAVALAGLLELAEKEFEDLRLTLSGGLERLPTILSDPDDATQLVRALVGESDPGDAGRGHEREFASALFSVLESLGLTQRSHLLDLLGDSTRRSATMAEIRAWRPWMNGYAAVDFLLRVEHPGYFDLRTEGNRRIGHEDREAFDAELEAFRNFQPQGTSEAANRAAAGPYPSTEVPS